MKPGSGEGHHESFSRGGVGLGVAGDNVPVFQGAYFEVGSVASKLLLAVGDKQWGVPVEVRVVFGE